MKFAKQPFAAIVPFFCLGIIVGDVIRFDDTQVLIALIGWLITVGIVFKKSKGKAVSIAGMLFAFVLLGVVSVKSTRSGVGAMVNGAQARGYLVHVDETFKKNSEWRKTVCTIRGVVDGDRFIRGKERALFIIKAKQILSGDVLMVRAKINPIVNKKNPGEFDSKRYWSGQDIHRVGFVNEKNYRFIKHEPVGIVDRWTVSIQNALSKILSKYLHGEELSVANALVLGNKDLLSPEERRTFSNAGAMHVLAVSGLHVGIVLYILMFIFSRFPRILSRNKAVLLAVLTIWVYAGVTGFSPSVLRASFMFSMLVIGQMLGKKVDALNILFFSGFILLLLNPLLIYNIGFQLSYLAMIGILMLYKPISGVIWVRNKWLRKVWEGTAVGIAAQVFTVPLSLYYFHQFANYFMLSNLIVMAFAGCILGIGLSVFVFHKVAFLGGVIGAFLGVLLSALLKSMQIIEYIPGAVAFGFEIQIWLLLGIYGVLLVFTFFTFSKKVRWVMTGAVLLLFSIVQYQRYENLVQSELVIFNHRSPVIAVKNKQNIICLYAGERESSHDYLLNAYRKIRPGSIKFIQLKEKRVHLTMPSGNVVAQLVEGGLELDVQDEKLFIRTNYKASISKDRDIVDMPYLVSNDDHYNLGEGAFVFSLE